MDNQQGRMKEPPSYISTKDLAYLKDAMSWELTAMKKCRKFAQESTCQKISNAIDETGQMHQQHYQTLLRHVNTGKAMKIQ